MPRCWFSTGSEGRRHGDQRRRRLRGWRDAVPGAGRLLRHHAGDARLPAARDRRRRLGGDAGAVLRAERGEPALARTQRRAVRGKHGAAQDVLPDQRVLPLLLGQRACSALLREGRAGARGHRTKGRGTSGKVLFSALRKAVAARGVRVRCHTRVTALLTDSTGRVIGVEAREIPARSVYRLAHRVLSRSNRKLNIYYRPLGKLLDAPIKRIEAKRSVIRRFRARRGVVLAAGGFVFDRRMLAEHAPAYRSGSSLGTIGDDGSGIRLGQSVGGRTDRMHRVSAWRFYNPPLALVEGVLVNSAGERICNELLYGAKIGDHIAGQPGAKAYLVVDQRIHDEARRQLPGQTLWFQRLQAGYLLRIGHVKADDVVTLARRAGIDPAGLTRTIEGYNADARADRPDRMGKERGTCTPWNGGRTTCSTARYARNAGFPRR
ncbi:FAD-binding protein [Prauserella oleivorans]